MRDWIIDHMNQILRIFFCFVVAVVVYAGIYFLIDAGQKRFKIRGQEAYSLGVECKQYGVPSTANPFIGEQNRRYRWLQGWSETEYPKEIEE